MNLLYYSPGACSLAVHAILLSVNAPFETRCVDIQKGENRSPEFLKINPRGQVPVLVHDGATLRESAVMAVYLLEKYKSPLLPAQGPQRLAALEWLGFYSSTLHQAYGTYFLMAKNLKDDAVRDAACTLAAKRIAVLWKEVEAHLEKNWHLAGEELTVPDLFHAVIANWTPVLAHPITLGPNIVRLCETVAELPYFRAALAKEKITYRVGE